MTTFSSQPASIRPGDGLLLFNSMQVHRRLAFLGLFYAFGFSMAYLVPMGMHGMLGWSSFGRIQFNISLICILSAIVLFFVAQWRLVTDKTLTTIALVWIVPAVLGILIAEGWDWTLFETLTTQAIQDRHVNIGISWACVTITIFPLLVSATVLQVMIASVCAACMAPVYLLGSSWVQGLPVEGWIVFGLSYPLFICAGIAILHGFVLASVRREVDQVKKLGSYKLEKLLGQGGMGEVWRARHQMLARPAAIKVIRPQALGPQPGYETAPDKILQRFEREVQATASLQSPHTISVYDFGLTDTGAFYYVMELLDGLNVQSLVERFGPVPESRALYLLAQACDSLEEAHHVGLIHRDIKPANLFVCRKGLLHDYLKVLDFGLVKTTEDTHDRQDAKLTADGVTTGTPAYMAPEVALGETRLDGRLDIYSLGCVAYWLVTQKEVFEAETPLAVVLKHVNDKPTAPSARTENPISAELESLILSCLEKDPTNRPQQISSLRNAIRNCKAYGQWNRDRSFDWWQIHQPG